MEEEGKLQVLIPFALIFFAADKNGFTTYHFGGSWLGDI